jgi:hypothetical protein
MAKKATRKKAAKAAKAATAKTKASGKYNTAKSNLIEAMKDAGVERCPVREGK